MVQTGLYAKAGVVMGMLEDKETGLSDWKRKLIFDYLEEVQVLINKADRRKDHKLDRRA